MASTMPAPRTTGNHAQVWLSPRRVCEFLLWDSLLTVPTLPVRPPSHSIHMYKISRLQWSASVETVLQPTLLRVAGSALFQRSGGSKPDKQTQVIPTQCKFRTIGLCLEKITLDNNIKQWIFYIVLAINLKTWGVPLLRDRTGNAKVGRRFLSPWYNSYFKTNM